MRCVPLREMVTHLADCPFPTSPQHTHCMHTPLLLVLPLGAEMNSILAMVPVSVLAGCDSLLLVLLPPPPRPINQSPPSDLPSTEQVVNNTSKAEELRVQADDLEETMSKDVAEKSANVVVLQVLSACLCCVHCVCAPCVCAVCVIFGERCMGRRQKMAFPPPGASAVPACFALWLGERRLGGPWTPPEMTWRCSQ
jgi:hypothetical protein